MTGITERSQAQRALLAIQQLKDRVRELECAQSEPLAIVGMGCRFPGRVRTPEQLWAALLRGQDLLEPVPSSRWDMAQYYDADVDAPGKLNCARGGFIADPERFDAEFFGISPREAERLDPQQRLLLEVSWEALERAGLSSAAISGSNTGVFVGMVTVDYLHMQLADLASADAHTALGCEPGFAAGRLSYFLNLQGPCVTLNTLCSSSLVALHYACASLRLRQCDRAIVAGVNSMLWPGQSVVTARFRALSPTGKCRVFDADADGFVRSEGCGAVVLRRLSDALADGDAIVALIRGVAHNHDGRGLGFTAPNGRAQEDVMKRALKDARLAPEQVHFVEAHGTGTILGDPIELESIAEVYGRSGDAACGVGAIKSNLGHTEAAAGMAGLIKVALSVQHGAIAPNANFSVLNERARLDGSRLFIAAEPRLWPATGGLRVGAVSSFGMSGSNTHAILSSAPEPVAERTAPAREHYLVRLSAKSAGALRALARDYAAALDAEPHELADVAYTANERRSVFEHRLCAVASNSGELREQLLRYVDSDRGGGSPLCASVAPRRRLAFAFTGQGALRPGAGLELYRTEPVFQTTFERCRQLLLPRGLDLLGLLQGEAEALRRTRVAQPLLFTLQCALVDLLADWNVRPDVVLGHSAGELAAAYCAGALELEAGCSLIARRAELMDALPEGGVMQAFALPESAVERALTASASRAEIAAVNSPNEVVVSGLRAELETLIAALGQSGTPLSVSHAFHSALMQPMLEEFTGLAAEVSLGSLRCQFASSCLGRLVASAQELDGRYWAQQLRQRVRFMEAVRAAETSRVTEWLEIGPRPLLSGLLPRAGASADAAFLPSLSPGGSEGAALLQSVGALHARGHQLDFRAVDHGAKRRLVCLPTYAFQRERHWLDVAQTPGRTDAASADTYQVEWVSAPRGQAPYPVARSWLLLSADALQARELIQLCSQRNIVAKQIAAATLPEELANSRQSVEVLDLRPSAWTSAFEAGALGATAGALLATYEAARAVIESQVDARLWLVTRGATRATSDSELTQACVWGFGHTMDLEQPRRFGALIDLCGASLEALVAELAESDGERQLALTADGRSVARVVRTLQSPLPGYCPSVDGVYVLAGGLGSLGLRLGTWLAQRGARKIALLARAPHAALQRPEVTLALKRIGDLGCSVTTHAVDVGALDQLQAAFRQIEAESGRIRGLVHAAGGSPRSSITDTRLPLLEEALRAKVLGAVNLDRVSAGHQLDLFLVASSISAAWGAPGFAHYAAANAFVDALMHHRRARGLAGTSVQWGPWSESVWTTPEARTEFERSGVTSLSTKEALAPLGVALSTPRASVIVAKLELSVLPQLYRGTVGRRLFERLAEDYPTAVGATPAPASPSTPSTLSKSNPKRFEARHAILEEVRTLVRRILRRLEPIDDERGFYDLGLDSILAVELRNLLQQSFDVPLPTTVVLEHPNVAALANFIERELGTAKDPSSELERPSDRSDGIAIIGIGCRMPGGANGPDELWQLLREGRDAIGVVPEGRWPSEARATHWAAGEQPGGFLDGDVFAFDTTLFGLSPREAKNVDPQQRLLLEVAWEAVQEAGYDPRSLRGSSTGVFVACGPNDYGLHGVDGFEAAYYGTGNAAAAASGRLSYVLGLQGPSLTVDAACASSLVAVHLACESLLRGECELAVAGGVSLMLDPSGHVVLSEAGMLSPRGKCRTFDAKADGYVRGEGCGVVVLKPLAAALADGDSIWAVITGSAVNQNGAGGGLTIPSASAQSQVVSAALSRAAIAPERMAYVEAHGTGTSLGDPIEVRALASVLERPRHTPRTLIGSIKTNIGHLEPAAGVAGLIKTALICRHLEVPPSLHFETANPAVDWEKLPLQVASTLTPLSAEGDMGFGVSSFGFTGTNAHVVLRRAPQSQGRSTSAADCYLLKVTGADTQALEANRHRLALALGPVAAMDVGAFCARANVTQPDLPERLCIAASTPEELNVALLQATQAGDARVTRGHVDHTREVALFCGNSALSWTTLTALAGNGSELAATLSTVEQKSGGPDGSQAVRCLFGHLLLAERLRKAGLPLALVAGQGSGELAAACLAGQLSQEAAIEIALRRAPGERALPAPSQTQHTESEARVGRPALCVGTPAPGPQLWLVAGGDGDSDHDLGLALALDASDRALYRTLAQLYCRGSAVDWLKLSHGRGDRRVPVPAYAFQRQRLRVERARSGGRSVDPPTPLLGGRVGRIETAGAEGVYELWLGARDLPFLMDHRLYDEIVVPGTFHLATALEVIRHHLREPRCVELEELVFSQPLRLSPTESRRLQVVVNSGRCAVSSQNETGWIEHLSARYAGVEQPPHSGLPALDSEVPRCLAEFYGSIGERELGLGPSFRLISELWSGTGAARATLQPSQLRESFGFRLFPGALDSALQVLAATTPVSAEQVAIPLSIRKLCWSGEALADGAVVRARLAASDASIGNHQGEIEIGSASGEPLLTINGFVVRKVDAQRFAWNATNARELIHEVVWRERELAGASQRGSRAWLVLEEPASTRRQLASDWHWPAQAVRRLPLGGNLLSKLNADDVERVVLVATPPEDDQAARSASERCLEALAVARALAERDPSGRIELTLITHRAVACQGESVRDRAGGAVWGLLRSVRTEHAGRSVRLLDVAERELGHNPLLGAALFSEIPELALRGPRALSWSVEQPDQLAAPSPLHLDDNGSYLITGGFGALGQQLALHLLASGAGRIVLAGQQQRPLLEALLHAGERVHSEQLDVTDAAHVRRVVERCNGQHQSLRAVFHLAATSQDCSSLRLQPPALERALSTKLLGAWHLHEATQQLPLDYFVLFSSIAAWNGNPGQAAYAAANAGLLALAAARWERGQFASLLDWGPWAGAGMFGRSSLSERVSGIQARAALAALDWALGQPAPGGHWLLAPRELVPAARLARRGERRGDAIPIPGTSKAGFLRALLASTLGVSVVDEQRPLVALGLDSLMAVEVRARISRDLSVAVPLDLLLSGSSLGDLVKYVSSTSLPVQNKAWVEGEL